MPNSWICIDASLVVRLLLDMKDQHLLERWNQWHEAGRQFAAPGLLFYEVANALYQYRRQGYLSAEACREALAAAMTLPIQRYSDLDLHDRALRLAGRYSLPRLTMLTTWPWLTNWEPRCGRPIGDWLGPFSLNWLG